MLDYGLSHDLTVCIPLDWRSAARNELEQTMWLVEADIEDLFAQELEDFEVEKDGWNEEQDDK